VTRPAVAFFTIAELEQQRTGTGKLYLEFLRISPFTAESSTTTTADSHGGMSAGLYVLAAGATDLQRPHHEDEMYYVIRGRARFRAAGQKREVSAGTVIFVAAEVEHRFYDILEELSVLVFFAPAES
jgi:mannose-6-phosphate isomerase-like protein (cupin superfamily)